MASWDWHFCTGLALQKALHNNSWCIRIKLVAFFNKVYVFIYSKCHGNNYKGQLRGRNGSYASLPIFDNGLWNGKYNKLIVNTMVVVSLTLDQSDVWRLYIYIYIYIYIKWTVFVNVTTKSAQHAHARMIAIIVEKSPNSSHMYDHGFMDNTNRQAVKNWLDSQTRDASLTSWRLPPWRKGRISCLWIKSVFDCLTIGIIHETMVVHMTWVWTFFNNYIYIYIYIYIIYLYTAHDSLSVQDDARWW